MTPESGGWRSMDTAPQDGTVVLGLFQETPGQTTRGDAKLRIYWTAGGWRREVKTWETGQRQWVRWPDGWRPLGGTP